MSNRQLILQSCGPEMEAAFSLQEYRERLRRIHERMGEEGIDLLFLSAPESTCYVSGYQAEWYQGQSPTAWHPASGIAIKAGEEDYIHFEEEDEQILTKITSVSRDVRIREHGGRGMKDFIVDNLRGEGWLGGTVGLEMWSNRPNRGYSELFQAALESENCAVVDATRVVRGVRRFKSPQELTYVRTAQRVADIGMKAAMETMRPGMTELDVYAEIVYAMAKAGGENPGITMPVCSGLKSACVHGLASRRRIMPGDIVNVDVSGVYNRYHANMARPFSMGEPHPKVAEYVRLVSEAVPVVADVIRPGLAVAELLRTVEEYYRDVGIWEDRWWVGGYELGIAFPPDWVGEFFYEEGTDPGDEVFHPGEVVNYEANFYLPKAAGLAMMINTMAFTEDSAEFLQRTPHDLIVIE